jgi:hypothetical protein
MSKNFFDNLKRGKWVLGFLFGAIYIQDRIFKSYLKNEYFGVDGKLSF